MAVHCVSICDNVRIVWLISSSLCISSMLYVIQATARASRDRDPGVMEKLLGDAPDVLKASLKQLRDKSLKTRTGILILLKELLATLPDNQISNVDQLLPGVISAINVCNPCYHQSLYCCKALHL